MPRLASYHLVPAWADSGQPARVSAIAASAAMNLLPVQLGKRADKAACRVQTHNALVDGPLYEIRYYGAGLLA